MKQVNFWKFLFQPAKAAVFIVSGVLDILGFSYSDGFNSLTLWEEIFFISLINIGWVLITIQSIIDWKKEKSELK